MEFFDWLNIPQIILGYLSFTVESEAEAAAQMTRILLICVGVAAALYLSGLLCGGFGLMTMAKKQGIKYWWLGFLPFGNTFLAGKLAGDAQVFGQRCKRIGLYAMLAEVVYVALEIALLVVTFLFMREEFYVLNTSGETPYYEFSLAKVSELYPENAWLVTFYNAIRYIGEIWWFVLLFMFVFLFTALFRKYYARSPFLMTFLCAFLPFRGFVLLAVRNNTPLDYTEYMRRRYEQMRQQQQPPYGGQGGYGSPYGGYNQGGSGSAGDPFSEFGKGPSGNSGSGTDGSSSDSPFSDF